ncbi:MAG: C39 family peptidase [Methanobacterium sp.]|jgi:predicted double-glycine peptidase
MYKLVAVLLVALIIGVTPAVAAEYSEITADTMAVKGKGADVASASELVEAVESRQATGAENETLTANVSSTESGTVENNDSVTTSTDNQSTGAEQITTTNDNPTPADDQATGADVQVPDLNDSLESNTVAIPQIDTSGIVMQSSDFSCGPAALATVLNNLGVHATEQELIVLAGTDTSGTTMHGLSEAAKTKGLSATGMKLSVDELKKNYIVFVTTDGGGHYSVIREIANESVKLADPSPGNIELSIQDFTSYYSSYVLMISDPNLQYMKLVKRMILNFNK